jgi:hypothetical protein
MNINTKICSKCGKEKYLSEFSKDKSAKIGVCSDCKDCRNKHQRTEASKKYRQKYYKKYCKTNIGKEVQKKATKKYLEKITFCCKDCGNRISLATAFYGYGSCKKCSRTLEVRKAVSQAQNGKKESKETCLKISKATRGKNNPRYINGLSKSRHKSNFSDELKLKIRKRDNFKCQFCGMTENIHVKKSQKVLTIHHIDYNKQNCNENNLITLCIGCNCKANGTKDLDRDYWFAYYIYLMGGT